MNSGQSVGEVRESGDLRSAGSAGSETRRTCPDRLSHVIGRRGRGAAPAGPVRVEELAARLVYALVIVAPK